MKLMDDTATFNFVLLSMLIILVLLLLTGCDPQAGNIAGPTHSQPPAVVVPVANGGK